MKLVYPEKEHEKGCREMVQEFFDNEETIISGSSGLDKSEDYDEFLEETKDKREGKNLKPGRTKSILHLIINDTDKIVGVISIRPELNDELRFNAGNIGYSIRPSERRKGYANIGLRLALEKCKELGLNKVLLTCDKDNIGSAKTITHNGGIWDSDYKFEGKAKERYWIPIN